MLKSLLLVVIIVYHGLSLNECLSLDHGLSQFFFMAQASLLETSKIESSRPAYAKTRRPKECTLPGVHHKSIQPEERSVRLRRPNVVPVYTSARVQFDLRDPILSSKMGMKQGTIVDRRRCYCYGRLEMAARSGGRHGRDYRIMPV